MAITRKTSASNANQDGSASRASSTVSATGNKKKAVTPATGGVSPASSPNGTISKAKGKEMREAGTREFVDPPRIIGTSPLRQGSKISLSPSPASKKAKKSAALHKTSPRPKATSSMFKSITYVTTAGLIAYTVLLCPHDKSHNLPVCSATHNVEELWNQHVYQPHIQPRIRNLVSHPSIAHIVEPVVGNATPIIRQVKSTINSQTEHLYGAYLGYSTFAQQELQKHSRPYVKQVHAHYDTHLDPYVSKYITPTYHAHVVPAIGKLEDFGRTAGTQMEPYLWQAANALHHGIREAQPHLLVLWGYAADIPGMVRERAWEPLVDMRRTYVDPQVSKMMEAVDEVGGDSKVSMSTTDAEDAGDSAKTDKADNTPLETVASEPPTSTSAPSSTSVPVDVTLTSEALEASTPSNDYVLDEEFLATFLRELDETDIDEPEPEPEPSAPEPRETETAEQAAERQRLKEEFTAGKRSGITRRHAEWEHRIKDLYRSKLAEFAGALDELRSEKVTELENAKHAETMQAEAGKALKNTEAFVRKLGADSQDGKTTPTRDEKVALLENIVGKVKKRFDDGASVVSGNVMTWWDNASQKELEIVERLVRDVRDLGTAAQSDLGLDYAYLDDVTVKDWTRYHDLLNAAKDLQAELTDLASGSGPNAPRNALAEAMRDLQLDLETVVHRFRYDLNTVHQDGLDTIRGGGASLRRKADRTDAADEPTVSILPIDDDDDDAVESGSPADAPYMMMGKSKEQVQDALSMAQAAVVHAEL